IVDYINANPRCTRRKLMEVLAPGPTVLPVADGEAGTGDGPKAVPQPEPTVEQTAVVADLHWLIHQGHVIEFANGTLETAKKPLPRPPKPEVKRPAPSPGQTTETPALELAVDAPGSGDASPPATESTAAEPGGPAEQVPPGEPASAAPAPV